MFCRALHSEEIPETQAISSEERASGYRSREERGEEEGAMQQNGQEQQERKRLQQTTEQLAQESASDSTATAIPEQEEQQLRVEQQKAEEYLDLLRRTQAEFVNYRRRMNQEQAEGRIAAKIELLDQLLPVLDDFGRALGTHEAITMEARADTPEGTILQVVRPGYALGERIIRPAQVIVAGSPSPVRSAPPQQEDSEC